MPYCARCRCLFCATRVSSSARERNTWRSRKRSRSTCFRMRRRGLRAEGSDPASRRGRERETKASHLKSHFWSTVFRQLRFFELENERSKILKRVLSLIRSRGPTWWTRATACPPSALALPRSYLFHSETVQRNLHVHWCSRHPSQL